MKYSLLKTTLLTALIMVFTAMVAVGQSTITIDNEQYENGVLVSFDVSYKAFGPDFDGPGQSTSPTLRALRAEGSDSIELELTNTATGISVNLSGASPSSTLRKGQGANDFHTDKDYGPEKIEVSGAQQGDKFRLCIYPGQGNDTSLGQGNDNSHVTCSGIIEADDPFPDPPSITVTPDLDETVNPYALISDVDANGNYTITTGTFTVEWENVQQGQCVVGPLGFGGDSTTEVFFTGSEQDDLNIIGFGTGQSFPITSAFEPDTPNGSLELTYEIELGFFDTPTTLSRTLDYAIIPCD